MGVGEGRAVWLASVRPAHSRVKKAPPKPRLQALPHHRPFLAYNAKHHAVPQSSACRHHMVAERPLLCGPDPTQCGSRLLIEAVGLELDTVRPPHVEGVQHHEVLRFRVDGRPLPGGSDPGPADLEPPVGTVNVGEPRGSTTSPSARATVANGSVTPAPCSRSAVSTDARILVGRPDRVRVPLEDLSPGANLDQPRQVVCPQWLEPHVLSLEYHRLMIMSVLRSIPSTQVVADGRTNTRECRHEDSANDSRNVTKIYRMIELDQQGMLPSPPTAVPPNAAQYEACA